MCCTQVLLTAWDDFERRAASADTVMALRQAHEQFVATAASCCFLGDASDEVRWTLNNASCQRPVLRVAPTTHATALCLCRQIREAIARVLTAAWKLTTLVRTSESRLSTIAPDTTWLQDLVRDHSASLQELVRLLQRVSSDRDRCVREFCEVRALFFCMRVAD